MPTRDPNSKFEPRQKPVFELLGGAVCLDFINTLDDRFSEKPKELLKTYLDLVRFAEDAGILHPSVIHQLVERSPLYPQKAKYALEDAIKMREAMFAVFDAIVQMKPAPKGPLHALNMYAQYAAGHAKLVPAKGHFEWDFDNPGFQLDSPLWPITRSATGLLSSDQLRFVRTCASEECQWFFLDTSKNHLRRWCDMTKCGNRAKFQRFYARKS